MAEDYLDDHEFTRTSSPQPGDLIVFTAVNGLSAHVGIVTDPEQHKFIGAQSSTGVKEASYATNKYWGKRPYRFLTLQARSNFIADRGHNSGMRNKLVSAVTPDRDSQPARFSDRANSTRKKPRFTLHPLEVANSQINSIPLRAEVEPERGSDRQKRKPKPIADRTPIRDSISQPVAYRVNIKSARIRLPELIEAAEKGKDVIIRDDNGNSFRLVPIR
jgi:hypothetical protein